MTSEIGIRLVIHPCAVSILNMKAQCRSTHKLGIHVGSSHAFSSVREVKLYKWRDSIILSFSITSSSSNTSR